MRIVFVDLGILDYTAVTPLRAPLGGTESALCYLSVELARAGHSVSVCNSTTTPGETLGVTFKNRGAQPPKQFINGHDVAIVISAADASSLRSSGVTVPLVMWTGHLPSFATVQSLKLKEEVAAWSAFAFVSDWQRAGYLQHFEIPRSRTNILRNAIAPSFEQLPDTPAWFETGAPPTLIYTSTPFRGLAILLHAFGAVRAAVPDVTLRIFSGMATYQAADSDVSFTQLYSLARSLPAAEYVGPVSQTRLAQEISSAAILAYPSIYEETSCIAALEAMRCGATVVTTRLGALPETVGEFGVYVDIPRHARELVTQYAEKIIETLTAIRESPQFFVKKRLEQKEFLKREFTWARRAQEWSEWLEKILSSNFAS